MKFWKSLYAGAALASVSSVSFAADSAAGLIAAGSPVCSVLGILPVFGGVVATAGGFIAAYNYMSGDQESRHRAKTGIEGILIGAGLILLLPMLVQYLFGFSVC